MVLDCLKKIYGTWKKNYDTLLKTIELFKRIRIKIKIEL